MSKYTSQKYAMMAENAFRFFRGTCHLFYEDLNQAKDFVKSPPTWICGDLHLENFGSYKGNNRLVYFDLNDFDEAALAPAGLELARMVTSIFTGFASLKLNRQEATRMATHFLQAYSATLVKGKALYIEPRTASGTVKTFLESVAGRKQKALLGRYAVLKAKSNQAGFISNSARLFDLPKKEKKALCSHFNNWIRVTHKEDYPYRAVDANFRIAGTGSVGVKRYVFLARHMYNPKKHLLIDMKQARPSSLAPFLATPQPSWASEAERVVTIQERMQNISPALLGTSNFLDEPYVIKELQPTADRIDFVLIKKNSTDILRVIEDMAILTASAQLRSSGRQGAATADELVAFADNPQWQQSIIDYASAYATQVRSDYTSFVKAYKKDYFS